MPAAWRSGAIRPVLASGPYVSIIEAVGRECFAQSRFRAASPGSGAPGESLGDRGAVHAVCAVGAETRAGPAAAVGPQRDHHERFGARRSASYIRAAQLVRVEAHERLAGDICGAPWRTASRTSCDAPLVGWTPAVSRRLRNPFVPLRMRLHSINSCGKKRCGSVTGMDSRV